MIFWLVAALLTGAVVAGLLPPLIGRTRPARGGTQIDRTQNDLAQAELAVYRAQLGELARECERGAVGPAEAAALAIEIERRMLKAAEAGAPPQAQAQAPWRAGPGAAIAAALLLPALALALYLGLGHPDLPAQPNLGSILAAVEAPPPQDRDLVGLVKELQARMAEHPGDPVGWRLLARALERLGRFADAAGAYAAAVRAGGGDGETLAAWGESLVLASEGQVTNESAQLFARALKADPKEPRARYYQGLARLQGGDPAAAAALWRALAADASANADWAPFVAERIRLAEAMVPKAAVPDRQASGPGAEDVAAAAALSPEERLTFIRGMVDRLAQRLEREPGDLEGWLRLAHAYEVLNEPARRRDALGRALALAPERPDLQILMADAEAASGERDAASQRLQGLLMKLPQDAPERAVAKARLEGLQAGSRDTD